MSKTYLERRIELEKRIANKVVSSLLSAGYGVGVYDGEETTLRNSFKVTEIRKALFTTDEDTLLVYKNGVRDGWVSLIWGNAHDIVSDYTVNLEAVLEPVHQYAENLPQLPSLGIR